MNKIILGLLLICISMMQCDFTKKKPTKNQAQLTALHYLYYKSLLCDTFSRILWDDHIDFRGLDSEKDLMYFLCSNEVPRKRALAKVALDTTQVEFSPCVSGECEFGGMTGNIDGYYAFRMPSTNLKVDSSQTFTCNLKDDKVNISFKELSQELDSTIYYNTQKHVDLSDFFQTQNIACNIGAYVSKKGKDPIIKKLVDSLTEGLKTNEAKAQKLLDFTTSQIEYSYEDHWYQAEITKRAHEVLFAGEADCSGKSTLYASMLEEANIPYCFLYFMNHINVGVQGKFSSNNKYQAKIDGVTYYMAETTTPNFIIGESKLSNAEILEEVKFYQIPQKSPNMYGYLNKKQIPFIDIIEE